MLDKSDLHDYQQATITYIYENDRTIAVLPVGGGKTVSTLTAFQELKRDGVVKRLWVFAPRRVAAGTWPKELKIWVHLADLRMSVVMGTPKQRLKALEAEADIYVINFDNLQWLRDQIGTLPADCMAAVDELTYMRTPPQGPEGKPNKGKRSYAMEQLLAPVQIRVGLTGTPMPKDQLDLYQQVRTIHGESIWPDNFHKWRKKYFEEDYMGYNWEVDPVWRDHLEADYARAAKIITEEELGKAHHKPVEVDHFIDLPPKAMRMHDDALKNWMIDSGGEDPLRMLLASAGVGSGKAKQIAAGWVYDEAQDAHKVHSEKMDALVELIADMGEPVCIFYEFRFELEALQSIYPTLQNIGSGTSDRKAARIIKAWQSGDVPVLAAHPASMSHGVDGLQHGGRQIVWLNLPWSNERYQQANGRIARQGQERTVFVHRLIAQNTLEDLIVAPRLAGREVDEDRLKSKLTSILAG